MGLLFDIIIILFVLMSVILVYSLLMLAVETKSFEFGVMRMVGVSTSGVMYTIVIQAIMFVIPAFILGFICSFPALKIGYDYIFSVRMGMDLDPVPTAFAVR